MTDMRIPWPGLGLLLLPVLLAAQDTTAVYTAPAVTITATRDAVDRTRLPRAVSTVGHRQIRAGAAALTLGAALRHVPGVVAHNRHNLSLGERLTMRGLGARAAFGVRGVKVLLDGIPLTTPDGTTQLGNIDLASARRIEVLRGPSASLYGNAGGGVLLVHTAVPAADSAYARPQLLVGSHGLQRLQANLGGGFGPHRLSVNLRHVERRGFRRHADALVRGVNAVGRHELPGTRWELASALSLYDAPYLLNPSSLGRADAATRPRHARDFVVSQGASKQVRQLQGGLTLRRPTADGRTEVTVYGVDRRLRNPIPGAVIELDRVAAGLRAVHGRRRTLAGWPAGLKAGFDLEWQRDERAEFDNQGVPAGTRAADLPDAVVRGQLQLRQHETVRSWAPFAAVDLEPDRRVVVSLGLRLDRFTFDADDRRGGGVDGTGSRAMGQLSPSAGLLFAPTSLVQLWANLSTAFQTPTANELSNRPGGAGGFNPDLEPESILGAEAGARGHWRRARSDWELALFGLRVDDMLLPLPVDDPASEAVYYRNAGRASSRGLELSLEARPRPALGLRLAGSWTDFTFDDYRVPAGDRRVQLAGNQVPGVAPWRLTAGADADGPAGLRGRLEAEWNAAFWANDFNGPPPGSDAPAAQFRNDAWLTVGLRLSAPLPAGDDGARLFFEVDNLFDARYNGSITPNAFGDRFFEPAPGRTVYGGLRVDVGGA